jgi:hypothetical protein
MAVISIEQAEPSMVLSGPVKDRAGRLLIPTGKVLSSRHIESLKMWGVATLEVEGPERLSEEQGQMDPELVMEAERMVADLFSSNDLTHPFINALARYCVNRTARDLQNREKAGLHTDQEVACGG